MLLNKQRHTHKVQSIHNITNRFKLRLSERKKIALFNYEFYAENYECLFIMYHLIHTIFVLLSFNV